VEARIGPKDTKVTSGYIWIHVVYFGVILCKSLCRASTARRFLEEYLNHLNFNILHSNSGTMLWCQIRFGHVWIRQHRTFGPLTIRVVSPRLRQGLLDICEVPDRAGELVSACKISLQTKTQDEMNVFIGSSSAFSLDARLYIARNCNSQSLHSRSC
jgi:hypothetical protein